MQGMSGSGKTSILNMLCCGEVVTTFPMVGFNVEAVEYRGKAVASVSACDGEKIRPLWRHFYRECSALVFVVDSTDPDRISVAAQRLERALARDGDLVNGWPVLVLANKQDCPGALSAHEVCEQMGLADLLRQRSWHVQPCCALSGDGLHEGLAWLASAPRRSRMPRLPSTQEALATLACQTPRRSNSRSPAAPGVRTQGTTKERQAFVSDCASQADTESTADTEGDQVLLEL